MKIKYALAAISLSLISTQCLAGGFAPYPATATTTGSGSASKSDTRFYAGLNWTLGGSMIPAAVIGVRFARVDSTGNVHGTDFSGNMPLSNFGLGKVKAKYFDGKDNGQGEIGLGYDFGPGKFLGTVGYNLPYFNLGTDYVLGSGFEPFAGIHTMGRDNKPTATPTATTYSCTGAQPATLVGTTCTP